LGQACEKKTSCRDSASSFPRTLIHPKASIGATELVGSGRPRCTDIHIESMSFSTWSVTVGHDAVLENYVSAYSSSPYLEMFFWVKV
jgi:hypothetical protein